MIIEKKLDWINISDQRKWKDSAIAKQFTMWALPTYVIVDASGKIMYNSLELKDGDFNQLEESF